MLNRAVFLLALLVGVINLPVLAQPQVSNIPEYVLTGTQLHEVRSDILNQDYQLMISLPDGYSQKSNKRYPVIYVLDGQWDFALVSSIYGKLQYDGDLPEAIVVGITWGGEKPDVDTLRARDFIPQSGNNAGAKLFLDVLEKELLPYVDGQFNSSKQRTLTGTSYGGLFATYAMLENPNLFDGYIALSAAYHAFPEKLMQQQLANLSTHKRDKALWFYLGCGSKDGCASSSPEFANTLTTMQLTNLHVKIKMEEGIGHASITPIAVTFGLQFVFERSFLSKMKSFFTSE